MRILFFSILVGSVFFLPYSLSFVAVILYALMFRAYELIIVGAVVDAQFGVSSTFPYIYTLSYAAIVIGAEFLKPWLSFYTGDREV